MRFEGRAAEPEVLVPGRRGGPEVGGKVDGGESSMDRAGAG